MANILLVEDSLECQLVIKKTLASHHILITDDPQSVESIVKNNSIDLILLDLSLPKGDGFTVLSELQASGSFSHIPVICVTSKDSVPDKVMAFDLGADEYLAKPFHPVELKARVESRIIKAQKQKSFTERITCGPLRIELASHSVIDERQGREVILTQTEFKLLNHFSHHPSKVFSREELVVIIWGDEGAVFDRAVDVHICSLRKKVSEYGIRFKAVPGIGYKMEIDDHPALKI